MRYYIDSITGTWGVLDDLIIVDTKSPKLDRDNSFSEKETAEIAVDNYLREASDQEIKEFANIYGNFISFLFRKEWRKGYREAINDVAGA